MVGQAAGRREKPRFLVNPGRGQLIASLRAVGVRLDRQAWRRWLATWTDAPALAARWQPGPDAFYWRLCHFPDPAQGTAGAVALHVVVGKRGALAWSAAALRDPVADTDPVRWVFALAEAAFRSTLAVLEGIDRHLALLEPAALADGSPAIRTRLLTLKRDIVRLRQLAASERDTVYQAWATLSRSGGGDLHDLGAYHQALRICETADLYRDIINTVLDTHLTAASHRLNEIVKTLTVVTTVMLPASVLASLWGTNFAHLPGAHSRYGFWGLLVAIAVVCGGLVLYFRRRGWF